MSLTFTADGTRWSLHLLPENGAPDSSASKLLFRSAEGDERILALGAQMPSLGQIVSMSNHELGALARRATVR